MINSLEIDPQKTALVVIDMQKGIVAMQGAPYSAQDVLANTARLVAAFRAKDGFVVLVNVGSRDGKDTLQPITDQSIGWSGERSKDWMELAPELNQQASDHLITKHQWGAFFGTDLDLQLRRRGIDTIVLCGIATNIGVETTAREAYQRNYQQIFAEDAMTAITTEEHSHTVKFIFQRLGRTRTTAEIMAAL